MKGLKEILTSKPEEPPQELDIDPGPCASTPRHKYVTALEVRHTGKPWKAYQYQHIATESEYEPTRFVLAFEGREERYKVIVKGRNLHGIYTLALQHRLEWLAAADRDFAEDGKPIILSVEVVVEKVKG